MSNNQNNHQSQKIRKLKKMENPADLDSAGFRVRCHPDSNWRIKVLQWFPGRFWRFSFIAKNPWRHWFIRHQRHVKLNSISGIQGRFRAKEEAVSTKISTRIFGCSALNQLVSSEISRCIFIRFQLQTNLYSVSLWGAIRIRTGDLILTKHPIKNSQAILRFVIEKNATSSF